MNDSRPKLVIFDLDKTLCRCNISFAFGSYLYRTKQLPLWHMLSLVCAYFFHKIALVSVQQLHLFSFYVLFLGKKQSDIKLLRTDFFTKNCNTLFRTELVERLKQAQTDNAIVWIQSSSPSFLVDAVADHFAVSHVTATKYAVDQEDRYCHVDEIVDGTLKKKRLEEYITTCNFGLDGVCAYSDSVLDLPLLATVGIPIAVSPDRALEKIAKSNLWEVLHL